MPKEKKKKKKRKGDALPTFLILILTIETSLCVSPELAGIYFLTPSHYAWIFYMNLK
ncbi:hypothetical protein AXX17_AT3G11850 [Arabidopsis thaliana]|uniref:Uncharacterized protein n=1 Tax=Arabidopsis thaliana TaxID=3702 RepID=A0A178V7V5_ARATH|nr:hypothetical protein AXX17_AT3G11850 [Arabidopsis thaliana]